MVFDMFAFAAWSLLEPILDRFWLHFGLPNRLKIAPESILNGIKLQCRFWTPSGTVEESISEPAWPQIDPNLTPKTTPNGTQIGSKIGPKTVPVARSPPKPILGRFWADLGSILDRFWADFGSTLDQVWVDLTWFLGLVSCRSCAEF